MNRSFDAIFKPRSIAIYGASQNPIKVGGRPLRYLLEQEYKGGIYPINPNYDTVQGVKCFHSVEEIPEGTDLVIIAVPANHTLDALYRCVAQKIKAAVVLTAGFSEAGPEGKALQEEMARLARESGMCILGPNCLGLMNITDRIPATFATVLDNKDIMPGEISLLSQSGAFGAHILGMAQNAQVGFNYWVTTGNEVDLQLNDCMEYVAKDVGTSVIASYIEDVRDGEKFKHALNVCLEQEKPVVLMKAGKTSSGSKAAMSHTGALAGNFQVYEAVFKQKGVIQANDLNELLDYASILTQKKKVNGNRVAIITISGGAGVMMADKCEENGLTLAEFSPETESELKDVLPAFASVKNPVDVTAQAVGDPGLFGKAIDICLKDGQADVLVIYLGLLKETGPDIARKIVETAAATDKPLVVTWVAGPQDAIQELKRNKITVFEEPIRGIKAVGKLVGYRLFVRKYKDHIRTASYKKGEENRCGLKQWLSDIAQKRKFLSEFEARRVLQEFDIPLVAGDLAHTAVDAVNISDKIGYPVVLKVNSPDIPHKSDVGGVALNLQNAREVEEAFHNILQNVRTMLGESVFIDGILVQKMEKGGVETLIGLKYDPTFGPAIAFGLGGIFVEVFKDVSLRIAPLDHAEAESMLREIMGKKILDGTRGKKRADQDAILDVLVHISRLSLELKDYIAELDINPLFAFDQEKGVKAGDALIVLK